jgi:hypothetical protein
MPLSDRRRAAAAAWCPKLTLCKNKFLPPALLFLHMWSTLAGWL